MLTRAATKGQVMTYRELAQGMKQNEALSQWGMPDIMIWLRDNCRCVYCGNDMLHSYETSRLEYEYDHLLPHCRYPELDVTWDDTEWKVAAAWVTRNIVLACRTCNRIKLQHDSNICDFDGNKLTPVYQKGQVLSSEGRRELIGRAKRFIARKRQINSEHFIEERDAMLEALNGMVDPDF